jgi:hypothetical protein
VQEAEAQSRQAVVDQKWVFGPDFDEPPGGDKPEDTNFTAHRGFDYQAIQKAGEQGQREAERGRRRGTMTRAGFPIQVVSGARWLNH